MQRHVYSRCGGFVLANPANVFNAPVSVILRGPATFTRPTLNCSTVTAVFALNSNIAIEDIDFVGGGVEALSSVVYIDRVDIVRSPVGVNAASGTRTTLTNMHLAGCTQGAIYLDGGSHYIEYVDVVENTAGDGAGVYTSGNVTMNYVWCVNNYADGDGSCVHAQGAAFVAMENCVFQSNNATGDATVYAENGGMLAMSQCDFINNTGGALEIESQAHYVSDSYFYGNKVSGGETGAGANFDQSVGVIDGCVFIENESETDGGGFACNVCELRMRSCHFERNSARLAGGGGRIQFAVYVSILDSEFIHNRAGEYGGGLWFESTPFYVENGWFDANNATRAGGGLVAYGGSVGTIFDTEFYWNAAVERGGGGLHVQDDTTRVNVTDAFFVNNTSHAPPGTSYCGGAVQLRNEAYAYFNYVWLMDNHAETSGGGLCVRDSTAHAIDTHAWWNSAVLSGGGVAVSGANASLYLQQGVMHSNSVFGGSGTGGGLVVDGYSTATLNDTLVMQNSASEGGGVHVDDERGYAVIVRSNVAYNYASVTGGGLFLDAGLGDLVRLNISDSGVFCNSAGAGGVGGVHADDNTLIGFGEDVIVINNFAVNASTGKLPHNANDYPNDVLSNVVVTGANTYTWGYDFSVVYIQEPRECLGLRCVVYNPCMNGGTCVDGVGSFFAPQTCDCTGTGYPLGDTCDTTLCGDGILAGSEQCDDGNNDNTDACSNACVIQTPFSSGTEGVRVEPEGGIARRRVFVAAAAISSVVVIAVFVGVLLFLVRGRKRVGDDDAEGGIESSMSGGESVSGK